MSRSPSNQRPEAPERETRLWSFGEEPPASRESLVRMAILFTAGAAVCGLATLMAASQILAGDSGFVFMLVIFGLPGLIVANFASQYLRDLGAAPITVEGDVIKKWHKGNLFIFFLPSYYIMTDSRVEKWRVRRMDDAGASVWMADDKEGFVPMRDLQALSVRHAYESIRPGDEIECKVTGMRPGGMYKLSCRAAVEHRVVSKVFSIRRQEYAMLLEGDQVRVRCFPHSLAVDRVERFDKTAKKYVPAASGAL